MSETKYTGRCPACGRELEVPAELDSFCCLYCGERLTYDRLEKPAADAQAVLPTGLDACLVGRLPLLVQFTRTQYAAAFERYCAVCRPVLMHLSDAACAAPDGGKTLLAQGAQTVLDAFCAELEADARWGRRRAEVLADARMLLAVYFAPMVGALKLPVSVAFNEAFRAAWLARYPKENYIIGNFESIEGEFHRRFKWLSRPAK